MNRDTYKLLFMFSLCSFLTPFIGSSINLALPLIGKEFDMNIVSLGWIASIFFLSNAVFLVPMGRLADIFGRKKIFLSGITLFTATSLLCSFATSGIFLVTARALQGLGSAMIFGTSMAIMISAIPGHKRGRALGINTVGVYLGSSLGPVLGGLITQTLGWRYIFIVAALVGSIVAIMGFIYLNASHDTAHAKGERFDLIGSILYGISVIAMLYGSTLLPALIGYGVMTTGVLTLIVFGIFENRIKHPVFEVHLLIKNKQFALANIAALLSFCASFSVPFLLSMYLQYSKEMLPREAGFVLLVSAITMMIFSPLGGRLADKKDTRILAALGMGCTAAALLAFSFLLSNTTPLYLIAIILFFFGMGMSLFGSPNTHAAMEAVSPRHVGLASSLLGTMRVFGQTVGMGISMLVLSLIVGKIDISREMVPQLIQSIKIVYLIFGILCIGGAFASLARSTKAVAGEEKV
jgi:EmrB/QacA subfamily drug resistance transporter